MTREERRLRDKLAVLRENDQRHEAAMENLCKAGGKTVNRVRAMRMKDKDAFISKHAEHYK